MEGRVVAYDAARGRGTVESRDGRRFGFHCTRIADAPHDLAVGTPVRFRVVPGQLGAYEADAVEASP